MRDQSRFIRCFGAALIIVGCLSACGGSHGASSGPLPALSNAGPGAPAGTLRAPDATTTDIVAINAGGGAVGSFAADTDYVASGTQTYNVSHPIDTSALSNPAPQAVYQSERYAAKLAYTIPGLKPGSAYTVRLGFAELYWTGTGKRIFNVAINNAVVLSNFDVYATAGAAYKAVSESFTATADSNGAIAIAMNASTNYAAVHSIEIASVGATPMPTQPPGNSLSINTGGGANGAFVSDRDFVGTGTSTFAVSHPIDTSAVTNPPPQSIFQDERYGSTVSYTIPGLSAGAAYTVRLDFAELYWTAPRQRVFNVSINNVNVLNNFDIFAATGATYKAIAKSFTTTANGSGSIAIALTAVTNNATIDGIEIAPANGVPPSPTPPPPPPAGFNDYATFGYDNQRDVYNPNSTSITPASLANLHLAWQSTLGGGDYNTLSQPVLATEIPGHAGVLFVDGGSGHVYGYDALSGSLMWTTSLGQESYTCDGSTAYFGAGGTAAYDPASRSIYVVGNTNASLDAFADSGLYRLDAATGKILGHVNFTPTAAGPSELDFSHTAVTLSNGTAYVGTGSTCDISSWRGRVAAINVASMTLSNTFFPLWDPQNTRGAGAQAWGGGGIWGWGGVSIDFAGNVLTGVGNADNYATHGQIKPPFVAAPQEYSGYAETLLELSPNLASVLASAHPIARNSYGGVSADLDVQGTPLLFRPSGTGCGTMAAIQGKSGQLSLYNENGLSGGSVAQYQLAPSTYADGYLGSPAYSPATGLVYADVASSTSPTLFAPGLIAINPGCGNPYVAWRAAFGSDSSGSGIPRAVPAVSAGGVIFAGTVSGNGGDLWALDASTGSILHGGQPLLHTGDAIRVPPTIDGNWLFVLDNSGHLYGLTIDSRYAAVAAVTRAYDSRSRRPWKSAPRP